MDGHFSRDLEGVLVISLEQAVAAPLAALRLADAGARVIKVERPGGDFARRYDALVHGQSAYFVWLNRGKESICLDLQVEEDRSLLRRLILEADIFIQNLKPGVLGRFGFESDELRRANPRLITCDISGFGKDGPLAGVKAYDLIVQAEVGLCAITGTGNEPARTGVSVCDISAGMTAHAAILQALLVQRRTGSGRHIEVSLFDSIADWMNVPMLQLLYGGHKVLRSGVSHPTISPYGVFSCQDAAKVVFSIQNEQEWGRFCAKVLDRIDLIHEQRYCTNVARVANRASLEAIIQDFFATLDFDQIARRLEAADIAFGRLNTIEEAAHHPHLRFVEIDTPGGGVKVVAPAVRSSADEVIPRAVPWPGQHDRAIREEFGNTSARATL
jgi:crotonobetainyl-CoA:carnitine CoA-transferase CaiB-like acyl-CoA transferase